MINRLPKGPVLCVEYRGKTYIGKRYGDTFYTPDAINGYLYPCSKLKKWSILYDMTYDEMLKKYFSDIHKGKR